MCKIQNNVSFRRFAPAAPPSPAPCSHGVSYRRTYTSPVHIISTMMAESTLPQKRNGDETVVSPKTKAQKKEEAILKAREWARKRKGVVGDDVETGISPKKTARAEEEDVITNLPDIPEKKSSRRSGNGADDISDTESIGSRTRSRRRSMSAAAKAATPAPEAVAPPKKRRGRPRRTPAKKAPPVIEEQVVEETAAEPSPVKEDEKEAAAPVEE